MPTAIAAPSIAARALDLPKPVATVPEASSFASSLHEARQKLPAKPADRPEKKADEAEPVEPAKKPEPTDRAADDQADVDAEPTDEVAASAEAEAKPEQHDDADANDPTALAQQMAALAAMQAQPTDLAQQPAVDAEQAAATDAATTIVAAAAAATTALPDDAAIGTELAGQATPTDPNAAKQSATAAAKPADAKLDKLTAELTPVDGTEIADAVAATTANAGDAGAEAQGEAEADALPLPDVETVAKPTADDAKGKTFDELFSKLMPDDLTKTQAESKPVAPKVEAAPLRPEQQFARDNVDRVVNSVQSQVNASGNGSMRVRLDPPELGALDVAVKMLDGKMTASFTTSNEQATSLLSHSLNNLKTSLENAGIAVDRIEVRQAAPSSNSSGARDDGSQQQSDRGFSSQQQQQGEQQRKQMVDRLWRKYAYGTDEVDLVA